jgi:predicted O-linked N-acetylglucosamine transferase (SPINDLY family)
MTTVSEAFSLALRHQQAGRLDAAEQICRRLLDAAPDHVDAQHLAGVLAYQRGEYQAALDAVGRAIVLCPSDARFHNTLGLVYRAVRNNARAIAAFHRAIELAPDYVAALLNLGNAFRAEGHLVEAAAAYRRALETDPRCASAANNLGNAWKDLGRLDEAADCYRQAIALNPTLVEAYNNLGNVLKDQGRLDEAIASYRNALKLNPGFAHIHSNLLYALVFQPDGDPRLMLEEQARWNRQHVAALVRSAPPFRNERSPDRRLRVGYVSPDFRRHPVGQFLMPLLRCHDPNQCEVHAFASVKCEDDVTACLRQHTNVWRDTWGLSDERLADIIRDDGIDILVDLTMHMDGNRLLMFARKPAPVQVTYLAYCGTTGLDCIDYRLTDPYLDTPGETVATYAEQSVWLAQTYWCYQPTVETPPVNAAPVLTASCVTFGCLNNFCKVSAPTLLAWARLLRELPQARLVLHAHRGTHRERVVGLFAQEGLDAERLEFVDFLPTADYFHVYHRIDIALDPFPYGGGTTTCDALWMGVPVVSLAGPTAVGRGGLSILSNVGVPELVARDVDGYVRLAVELARDLPRLTRLRKTLRRRLQASPLMDAPRFARNVEAAYREMWRRWCRQPIPNADVR